MPLNRGIEIPPPRPHNGFFFFVVDWGEAKRQASQVENLCYCFVVRTADPTDETVHRWFDTDG